ncbi:hydrolase [Trichlorobacter lovleyi]|uniref:Isochorismatase hydrolase n=1 Tax=Trichlorobacter lovleyi (strain ATCC BAA-1151 / DSM 17278 / SZ) TaxID=398767 RepID=B3E8J4_TRIL1|nr:hydrolase [Trichlorobacter lovleyi]ACD96670.1 isochorismatase hydrolase [Trichlorobacter lovleyi SZ]
MTTIRQRFFLDAADSVLVVIDVQERLCKAMDPQVLANLTANTAILLESAAELQVPVVITEQYVKGLGETLTELQEKAAAAPRLEKMTFSCCGCSDFVEAIRNSGRRQIVMTGMETHVCVLQTAVELLDAGYVVHLVQDAVMSRSEQNKQLATGMMQQAGAVITCTESVLFQWLKAAGTDSFKKLSKLVK